MLLVREGRVRVEEALKEKISKLAERFFSTQVCTPHQPCPTFDCRFDDGVVTLTEVAKDDRFSPADAGPEGAFLEIESVDQSIALLFGVWRACPSTLLFICCY